MTTQGLYFYVALKKQESRIALALFLNMLITKLAALERTEFKIKREF